MPAPRARPIPPPPVPSVSSCLPTPSRAHYRAVSRVQPERQAVEFTVLRASGRAEEAVFTARLPWELVADGGGAPSDPPPSRLLLARPDPAWRLDDLGTAAIAGLPAVPRPTMAQVRDALLTAVHVGAGKLFDHLGLATALVPLPPVETATMTTLARLLAKGHRVSLRLTREDLAEATALNAGGVIDVAEAGALLRAAANGHLSADVSRPAAALRSWLLARRAALHGALAEQLCATRVLDGKVSDPADPEGESVAFHLAVAGWEFAVDRCQNLTVRPRPRVILAALPGVEGATPPAAEDLFRPLAGVPSVVRAWRGLGVPVSLSEALRGDLHDRFVTVRGAGRGRIRLWLTLGGPARAAVLRYRPGVEVQDVVSAARLAIRKHPGPWDGAGLTDLEDAVGRILSLRARQDRDYGPRIRRRLPAGLGIPIWLAWWASRYPDEEPKFIAPVNARSEFAPLLEAHLEPAFAGAISAAAIGTLVRNELLDPFIWRGIERGDHRWWHRDRALAALERILESSMTNPSGTLHGARFDIDGVLDAFEDAWTSHRTRLLERHLAVVKDLLRPMVDARDTPRTGERAAPLFIIYMVGTVGAEARRDITHNLLDGLFPDATWSSWINTVKLPPSLVRPGPWDLFLAKVMKAQDTRTAAAACGLRDSGAFAAFVRSGSPFGDLDPVDFARLKPRLVTYCAALDREPQALAAGLAAGWHTLAERRASELIKDLAARQRFLRELETKTEAKEKRAAALLAGRRYRDLPMKALLDLARLFGRLRGDG